MAALLLELLRRKLVDVVLLGGFVVVSVLLIAFLPLAAAVGLWALLAIVAFTHASLHDTGDEVGAERVSSGREADRG